MFNKMLIEKKRLNNTKHHYKKSSTTQQSQAKLLSPNEFGLSSHFKLFLRKFSGAHMSAHGVLLGPAASSILILGSVSLVHMCYFRH
jgi:hypothetical protein